MALARVANELTRGHEGMISDQASLSALRRHWSELRPPLSPLLGDDDHAAGALAEDGLQGLVVEGTAAAVAEADDNGGGVDQLCLVGDVVAGLAGADALDVAGDALATDQLRLLDLALRLFFLRGELGVERQVGGDG